MPDELCARICTRISVPYTYSNAGICASAVAAAASVSGFAVARIANGCDEDRPVARLRSSSILLAYLLTCASYINRADAAGRARVSRNEETDADNAQYHDQQQQQQHCTNINNSHQIDIIK